MHVMINTGITSVANIFEGDTLFLNSAHALFQRYVVTRGGTYANGAEVPVKPIDGAPDLLGGERLTWDNPRPGCAFEAVAVKPLTRAEFDRLERKVDDLLARLSSPANIDDALGKQAVAIDAILANLRESPKVQVFVNGKPLNGAS